jgi:hypothetical protein
MSFKESNRFCIDCQRLVEVFNMDKNVFINISERRNSLIKVKDVLLKDSFLVLSLMPHL